MAVKVVNSANFKDEVLSSDIPVLVDFYADWCGPCRQTAPIIEEISNQFEGKLKVCKVNVDEQKELAGRFGIMYIPTIKVFKNGAEALSSVGAKSREDLLQMLGL